MSWYLVHLAFKGFHPNEFESNIKIGTSRRDFFILSFGGLHVKCAVQREIRVQTQHLLWDKENHWKPSSRWPVAGPFGCKLTSSQQSGIKYESPNTSSYICCFPFFLSFFPFFVENISKLLLQKFYLYMIWINTKPCITPAKVMNAYMHKYAYNYTYIYVIPWLSVNLEVHCIL
jgi:hypothetical protein